jgi:hypothetical protein
MYTKDAQSGELKAASVGIILLDIARALGARIGAEVVPVGHPTFPEMLTCLTTGACDTGFMGLSVPTASAAPQESDYVSASQRTNPSCQNRTCVKLRAT